ncbi:hypothetical protein MsAm2_16360 [Methanolapillus ohkumae]|uniref:Uncharacterized protein n=1 Tax=Methanolapillus ohkumae TaxID=3028298 RepID=A0AA96V6V2_9EURY|nr:hypothetical protein MsAm2_16360 [Methanosarcinaceae archaeon Am2]
MQKKSVIVGTEIMKISKNKIIAIFIVGLLSIFYLSYSSFFILAVLTLFYFFITVNLFKILLILTEVTTQSVEKMHGVIALKTIGPFQKKLLKF